MSTHVFYAPHADDEALAFAGIMARVKAEGHTVVLVLLTESFAAGRIARRMRIAEDVAHLLRRYEFRASGEVLGADRIVMCDYPEPKTLDEMVPFHTQVLVTLARFHAEYGPDTVHHLVAGESDPHVTGTMHPAHMACERAGHDVKEKMHVDLHHVYIYSHPMELRVAPEVVGLTAEEMALKRRACGCHTYGWKSVQDLFEQVVGDHHEYVTPL